MPEPNCPAPKSEKTTLKDVGHKNKGVVHPGPQSNEAGAGCDTLR